ncbi:MULTISPECIES: class I SAM-dependent methyltransferase [Shewanella]|jgi:ubiquinone/menaquinone biosynthesis C-methylase UbiE|uniref:class I SAM-dependent methyltransferase n=1 Tax=Shewanella TaxID=22 RepID=UPI001CF8647B|nr:class I SAM-dependent methyltransferase [Shewanella glacialimarina]UCX04185.1 class I SAM-dependent methyltransferase [Shewanella glacialimarina]
MDKYQISVNTFDKLAQQYQDKYMNFESYADTYDTLCSLLKSLPQCSTKTRVLDVACGPGNITRFLLDKLPNIDILATDLAPNMVMLAQQNNPTARFAVMDSRQLSRVNTLFKVPGHESRQFDAIVCGFGLPYLDKNDVTKLIKDMAGLLKAGGLVYISTMEDDVNKSGFQTSSSGDQVYIHYYQGSFLVELLEQYGFDIIELQRKQFQPEGRDPTVDLFIFARYSPQN